MLIRYLVLSPSLEQRQNFFGQLFGTFEISPLGKGEKYRLSVEGGDLELVGAGHAGKLAGIVGRFLDAPVQVDGILILIASGDGAAWNEAQEIGDLTRASGKKIAVKTFVFEPSVALEKETARKALLGLFVEQERLLAGPP